MQNNVIKPKFNVCKPVRGSILVQMNTEFLIKLVDFMDAQLTNEDIPSFDILDDITGALEECIENRFKEPQFLYNQMLIHTFDNITFMQVDQRFCKLLSGLLWFNNVQVPVELHAFRQAIREHIEHDARSSSHRTYQEPIDDPRTTARRFRMSSQTPAPSLRDEQPKAHDARSYR